MRRHLAAAWRHLHRAARWAANGYGQRSHDMLSLYQCPCGQAHRMVHCPSCGHIRPASGGTSTVTGKTAKPATPCRACGLPRQPNGACFHCDDPCRIPHCHACAEAATFQGAGPASTGPVPARWPDGTPATLTGR